MELHNLSHAGGAGGTNVNCALRTTSQQGKQWDKSEEDEQQTIAKSVQERLDEFSNAIVPPIGGTVGRRGREIIGYSAQQAGFPNAAVDVNDMASKAVHGGQREATSLATGARWPHGQGLLRAQGYVKEHTRRRHNWIGECLGIFEIGAASVKDGARSESGIQGQRMHGERRSQSSR